MSTTPERGVQAAVSDAVDRAMLQDRLFPGVSFAGLTSWRRDMLREQRDTAEAKLRLGILVNQVRLNPETVEAEVERRAELFAQVQRESPRSFMVGPEQAAVRSVYDDIAGGRWL